MLLNIYIYMHYIYIRYIYTRMCSHIYIYIYIYIYMCMLVGKGSSDGSSKAMKSKDLLVGKGAPMIAPAAQSSEIQKYDGWQREPRWQPK